MTVMPLRSVAQIYPDVASSLTTKSFAATSQLVAIDQEGRFWGVIPAVAVSAVNECVGLVIVNREFRPNGSLEPCRLQPIKTIVLEC
jgi:hypothetical protein